MGSPATGQHGIRFREALLDGNRELACALLADLDHAHVVELVLGQALRDGRDAFLAARRWVAASNDDESKAVIALICRPGADRSVDELAAAYIAARRVPDRWIPNGRALSSDEREQIVKPGAVDLAVAAAYGAGASGSEILGAMHGRALYEPVNAYYRQGSIHALGPRPLLVLAAYSP